MDAISGKRAPGRAWKRRRTPWRWAWAARWTTPSAAPRQHGALCGLTPSEVAQVMGTSAEYKMSEVADGNAGIVLKIAKES